MSQITTSMTDTAIAQEMGRRLLQARLEQNISQEQMAEEIGISRNRYSRLEQGNGKLEVLIAALRVLNKLDALDAFLPDESFSPLAALKQSGKVRRRARSKNSRREHEDSGDLDW